MYEFLAGHTLRRDPGESYEYSNLGAGLLGHLLAWRAGKSYEDLLRERIIDPLGMRDTRIVLTDAMKSRLAQSMYRCSPGTIAGSYPAAEPRC